MRELSNLGEMRSCLPNVIVAQVEDIVRETVEAPAYASVDAVAFADVFGSPMFLVETVADLAAVRSFEEGPNGRLSLLDTASEWFDVARWEANGAYAVFATVDNPNGGPQYFVPAEVAVRTPNVAASIELKLKLEGTS